MNWVLQASSAENILPTAAVGRLGPGHSADELLNVSSTRCAFCTWRLFLCFFFFNQIIRRYPEQLVVIPKVINYEEHLDVEGIPGDCVYGVSSFAWWHG